MDIRTPKIWTLHFTDFFFREQIFLTFLFLSHISGISRSGFAPVGSMVCFYHKLLLNYCIIYQDDKKLMIVRLIQHQKYTCQLSLHLFSPARHMSGLYKHTDFPNLCQILLTVLVSYASLYIVWISHCAPVNCNHFF